MLLGEGGGQPTSVCGIDSNPGRLVVASFAERVVSGQGNVKSVVTSGDVEAGKQVTFDQCQRAVTSKRIDIKWHKYCFITN